MILNGNPTKTRRRARIAALVLSGGLLGTASLWAQDLGAAKSFAILSSGADVSFRNRVQVSQPSVTGAACPGAVGCPGSIGGTTILMGRGNSSSPDTVSGDVIATATSSQGLNCANNPPGTTAICLGNDSEIAGACVTGGGAVSSPSECDAGTDASGSNPELATLQQASAAVSSFSSSLAALAGTQSLAAITVGTGGTAAITGGAGANVVNVPSITAGNKSTITINAGASETMVINIGSSTDPGSLQLGNHGSVILSGGITADRVVFNLVGSGATAQLGNDTVFNGTILAPSGQFTCGDGETPRPILINGALLFGGSVSLGNNVNLNFYPSSVTSGSSTGGSSGPSS